MEVTDAEAESSRRLEAATGGVHADGGRSEWVLWREDQRSPVLSILVGSLGRACEYVVPSMSCQDSSDRTRQLLGGTLTPGYSIPRGVQRYMEEDSFGYFGIRA